VSRPGARCGLVHDDPQEPRPERATWPEPNWQAVAYLQINVPTGTYLLSTAATTVNRSVFDAEFVVKKGQTWFPVPGRNFPTFTLTVT
jgi:hypothetical protein